jgi:magnesium-transporting ATPase (P-type)
MNLLSLMNEGATNKLSAFVTCWLVPLSFLFNIAGWVGLPQREANRSNPRLSDQEISDLGRAVWGAWLVGVLVALAGLCAISKIFQWALTDTSFSYAGVWGAGLGGLLLGVARVFLPRIKSFRRLAPIARRRVLSILVICAVALSAACGVLYYEPSTMLHSLIASTYICMFIGYAGTHVLEVGR